MKKLLSMLGAITLIGTASTNVIACVGGEKPNPPTPDTRTDISNKITSPLNLGQLSANTKVEFLAKLQTALTQIPNLNTITSSDYNVYKAGTTDGIKNSDITAGNYLNIKITANGSKFTGEKDNITVNYTQKDTKIRLFELNIPIDTPSMELEINDSSTNKSSDFKDKLIEKLKQDQRTKNMCKELTTKDINILKTNEWIGIKDSDIKNGNLQICIRANLNSKKYEGDKITVITIKMI